MSTDSQQALTHAQEGLTRRLSEALTHYLQETAAVDWEELTEDYPPHMDVVISVSTVLVDVRRAQQT